MRLRRQLPVAGLVVLAAGCSSSGPSAPPGALLGKWGGQGAELTASATTIDMRIGCGLYRAAGPLIPDAAGRFVLELGPGGRTNLSATVTGTASGATIALDAALHLPWGESSGRFVVAHGVAANYTYLSCTLLP